MTLQTVPAATAGEVKLKRQKESASQPARSRLEHTAALLMLRWYTLRDLSIALGVTENGTAGCCVQQIARSRLVFTRKATALRGRPRAYRMYPEAVNVEVR